MSWSKIIAIYFVIAQMVLAPAISRAVTPGLEIEDGKLTQEGQKSAAAFSKYAAKMNYESRLDLKNNRMYFVDQETKKVVGEVALRDQKSLMEYSPRMLNSKFRSAIALLKTASKESTMHAMKSFPVESAAFFLALGGMTAIQLLTNYADNPVGMKQHIEHSLSPVGQLGFFMFMYSQGVTGNVLNMWLKRPALGIPIGMLGMTVGMAVQGYFSQVVNDPHIRACTAAIFKGEKAEGLDSPCDSAYKYLVVDKKILEGPGIASLLGSFLVVTGTRLLAGAMLKAVGIELTTLLMPGGLEVKGVRWLVALASSGVSAAAFTVVQMKLEHYISYAWKNYFDGKEFVGINDSLVAGIEAQKKSQWSGKTDELNQDLRDFSKKMGAWRINNLSEAYMAHQAWADFLGELTSNYTASFNFYDVYVKELLSPKDSGIDRLYPLYGVKPKNLADGNENNYFTRPERIEMMQIETAKDVGAFIAENLQNGRYKQLGLVKYQTDIMTKIQNGLISGDAPTQGKAILELNSARRKYFQAGVGSMDWEFSRELYRVASMLGEPNPMFEKGRGFAATMMMSPGMMEPYKNVQLEKYNGFFKTPTVADYFIVQMMCGPDVTRNEKTISIFKGFPAKFSAPTITLEDAAKDRLCHGATANAIGAERLYNLPVGTYKTAPDFLRGNINPEVSKDFDKWWEDHTEAEMKAAFQRFGQDYKGIIAKLYKGLNETKNSSWNHGLISNGAMLAAFQEARMYSLVLGEILKDTYKATNKKDLPQQYFSPELDPDTTVTVASYNMSKKPVLAYLAYAPRFDFTTLTSRNPNANVRSLKIQKELDSQFALMNILIQKARTQYVKTAEYQNRLNEIESTLTEFSDLLGIKKSQKAEAGFSMPAVPGSETATEPSNSLVTLKDDQRTLAVTCLELLQSLSQELVMYGKMAGTATYPELKKLE